MIGQAGTLHTHDTPFATSVSPQYSITGLDLRHCSNRPIHEEGCCYSTGHWGSSPGLFGS